MPDLVYAVEVGEEYGDYPPCGLFRSEADAQRYADVLNIVLGDLGYHVKTHVVHGLLPDEPVEVMAGRVAQVAGDWDAMIVAAKGGIDA